MALIQDSAIGLRLKNFLGLTHLPDTILAPEQVGVIIVGDISAGGGGRGAQGGTLAGPTVAERSSVSLSSPVAAGNLRPKILVNRVMLSTETTGTVLLQFTGAAYTPDTISASKGWEDLDFSGPPSAQLGNDTRDDAALPTRAVFLRVRVLANTMYDIPLDMSLGSRTFQNHLIVSHTTDNVTLHCSFQWTEFLG